MRKRNLYIGAIILCCAVLSGCNKNHSNREQQDKEITNTKEDREVAKVRKEAESKDPEIDGEVEDEQDCSEQMEKGYDLPIDDGERNEAENDCKDVMQRIKDIYVQADKGDASNIVISDETMERMQGQIKQLKCPVTSMVAYANMDNYKEFEDFIKNCQDGKRGSIKEYEIHFDGSIGRNKFIYDGTDMYVLSTSTRWEEEDQPFVTLSCYNRIKEWKYTAKGWFGYELCVAEYPEVSEMINGNYMVRVKPITSENRELSKNYVLPLGYQGNNLLCSNWDMEHMEELDLNGAYEYLYQTKYHSDFDPDQCPNGIPKDEFEQLIMEYLPIKAETIKKTASYDKRTKTYPWTRVGSLGYELTSFGTSIPEVKGVKENIDGTMTLTVDAVCSMMLCNDAVITHELTVKVMDDGTVQYLGNKILDHGIENIPEYQYRIVRE